MRLKSFGLSNFKAFGQSLQRLPLKPITLIFGPNSAGKSSLIHGLLWTTEVVMQDSFDIRTSKRVSGTLDLGGFQSVLRGHDPTNKIRIALESENGPSEQPIQITYEIGIRTDEDAGAIYKQEWLDKDPDVEKLNKFNNTHRVMEAACGMFSKIFNWVKPSSEEIESALASEAAWEKQVEHHRRHEEADGLDSTGKLPSLAEAKELYNEAQNAWTCRRELAPAILPRFQNLWQQFTAEKLKEIKVCSVISCEVQIGAQLVLRAVRQLGSETLTIDPLSFESGTWQKFPTADLHPNSQETRQTRSAQTAKCLKSIGFSLPPAAEVSPEESQIMLCHAIPWLVKQRDNLPELLDHLIFVGPLRALPTRRELLGFPNEMAIDPLLLPWQRLRDDSSVQDSVNKALKSLTNGDLSFRRVAYGRIERVAYIEKDLPDEFMNSSILMLEGGFRPTDWDEPGFMEGFVRYPRETMPSNPGPFYEDLKENDPNAALQMIEEHLTKRFSHEILFDLLLRDGRSGVDIKPQDVGVGISQIAPVLVQSLGNQNRIIAIEQPEIHIHPALQAELGDVFIESALGENKNTFLLETHSEHLILRILRRIRETTEGEMAEWPEALRKACPNGIRPEDVAVLYVQPGKEGAEVLELPVDANGEFTCDWPGGFFEERMKELF